MDFSIVCKGLRKEFQGDGIKTRALAEVNATFKKGEFVSIVGTSGSGKSTLLSILGTLDSPTSGSILYDNEDIKTYNKNGLADFRFNHI
ncbi:ATP-binding cassette domain-containing protein, partial [Rossellomorea marisflavi]|uniref:ATP-binding cassette domain-containing protein n=1 Tax=Rossellomorea marisflavi TaxID=189381 RepID=UPI003513B170